MVQSDLETELLNMIPTTSEPAAITALTDAYGIFAAGAESNTVPLSAAGVTAGKAAMSSALVGMSLPGVGLIVIPLAVIAFWVAAATPAGFPGALSCVPPPNAALAAKLAITFPANVLSSASLADATKLMAADMFSEAVIGGTCLFGIIPFPIL